MDSLLLVTLFIGVYVTWATEALGSIIRKASIAARKNVLGSSIVQAIGVFSRLGFFLQTFAIAWIIDEHKFSSNRYIIALCYCATVMLALISTQYLGKKLIGFVYARTYHFFGHAKNENKELNAISIDLKKRPSTVQVIGYVFLYFGGIFPLIGQLINPDFAARSLALASIINGISTILLIAIVDMKMAIQIESSGISDIPDKLYVARYIALFINFVFLCAFLIISLK